MRRGLLISYLMSALCICVAAQSGVPILGSTFNGSGGGGGGGTWTLVQHKHFDIDSQGTGGSSCAVSTTSCTVTISAPAAGNIAVVTGEFGDTVNTRTMSAPTGGQTWTHCGSCAFGTNITDGLLDAWYVLNETATGQTSVTCNYSGTNDTYQSCDYFEFHYTGSSASFDTSNGGSKTACSTCAAPALTLGGTNDVIVQMNVAFQNAGVSAIGGVYVATTYDGAGQAYGLNIASYTAPNWTMGSSSTATVMAIAIKGN